MKLIVCLFLIVVLLEEYNCAPHTRTRSRHRHQHGLQHGSSRHRSPYRSPGIYSRYGHGYYPYHYTHHPWRASHHRTWHSPRYSSGFGYRHRSHAFAGYNPRYGTKHLIQNTTPKDKIEEKHLIVVTPIFKLVENTTAKPEDKSTEHLEDESTGKPLDMLLKKPADLVDEPVEKSTANPTRAVSVTAAFHEKIPEDKPQHMTVKKVTERPVEMSMVKPTLTITVTAAYPVKMPEDKPQDITITKATETPVEKTKPAVIAVNPVTMPADEHQDVTYEKPLEPKPVENSSENRSDFNKLSSNPMKSSSENLSDYSTVNPFNYWPIENQLELSTENPFQ